MSAPLLSMRVLYSGFTNVSTPCGTPNERPHEWQTTGSKQSSHPATSPEAILSVLFPYQSPLTSVFNKGLTILRISTSLR